MPLPPFIAKRRHGPPTIGLGGPFSCLTQSADAGPANGRVRRRASADAGPADGRVRRCAVRAIYPIQTLKHFIRLERPSYNPFSCSHPRSSFGHTEMACSLPANLCGPGCVKGFKRLKFAVESADGRVRRCALPLHLTCRGRRLCPNAASAARAGPRRLGHFRPVRRSSFSLQPFFLDAQARRSHIVAV